MAVEAAGTLQRGARAGKRSGAEQIRLGRAARGEMREDAVDDLGVFDARDDAGSATAALAQTHIDVEYPAQPLGPAHRLAALSRGAGVGVGASATTAAGGGDHRALSGVRGKAAVIAREVHSRLGHQRRQACEKVQRMQDYVGGAVTPGSFDPVAQLSVGGEVEAAFGERGAGDVAREQLEDVRLARGAGDAGVQREAVGGGQSRIFILKGRWAVVRVARRSSPERRLRPAPRSCSARDPCRLR